MNYVCLLEASESGRPGDSDGDDMTKRIYHAILSARKFLVDLQPKALEEC